MIIDASALLAILFDEPESAEFTRMIAETIEDRLISPVNYVEASIRADDPRAPAKADALDSIMEAMAILIAPISAEQARIARDAYGRFGKGRHRARLNLGDCFAYALAKSRNEPLLFKGNDFMYTDIEAAP